MNISQDKLLSIYRTMYLTRRFDETAEELNRQHRSIGSIHTGVGEEAMSVGVTSVLRDSDVISPSYRDVGVFFARGITTLEVAGLLFGKKCGLSHGKTRVLHAGDLDRGLLPANPILGASTSIALGAALAFKKDHSERVVVNLFGDGASNEGAVHEAMNFAAVFNLPIIFVILNNHYAWSTPTEKIIKTPIIADRAKAYGFAGYVVNGNDVMDVCDTMEKVVDEARKGGGPALVECRGYRWSGHSGNDKNVYRTQAERIYWRQDCPIKKLENYFLEVGICRADEIAALRDSVEREIQSAIAQAEGDAFPVPESVSGIEAMLYQN